MRLSVRHAVSIVVVIICVVVGSLFPILVLRVSQSPTEDEKYIRRLFAEHTVGQTFSTSFSIAAMDVLIRTQESAAPLAIEVLPEKQKMTKYVHISPHEQWLRFSFSSPLPAGQHTFILRSPNSQHQKEALLVRFQIDSKLYTEGTMLVDGRNSYGDIAFRVYERMPSWKAVSLWSETHPGVLKGILRLILLTILLTVLTYTGLHILYRTVPLWTQKAAPLFVLSILALCLRVPYVFAIQGVYGGDAFNYLFKAQALLFGQDPFTADPRKGPLYSLLLVPGFFTHDPLLFSRWVGVCTSIAAVVLLPLLLKRMHLPWGVALGSGLLLAVNQDFIWEAPSGLANTFYTTLFLFSLYCFTLPPSRYQLFMLAISVGSLALTRYEGMLIGIILLPAAWIRDRLSLRTFSRIAGIAVLIAGLPLLSFFFSGSSGIRTPSDVLQDTGLRLTRSNDVLVANILAFREFLGRLWIYVQPVAKTFPAIGIGVIMGWYIPLFDIIVLVRKRIRSVVMGGVLFAIMIGLLLTDTAHARELLAVFYTTLCGIGIGYFIHRRGRQHIPTFLAIVFQFIVITLILPKGRYYLPLIPFCAAGISYGIAALVGWQWNRLGRVVTVSIIWFSALCIGFDGHRTLGGRVDLYNKKAQDTIVMIQATQFLRTKTGNIGFPTDSLPARIYLPPTRMVPFDATGTHVTSSDIDKEQQWIEENHLAYLVETNTSTPFSVLRKYPNDFLLLREFTTPAGSATVRVYTVQTPKKQ